MKALRFHVILGEDRMIRIPDHFPLASGQAEIIVLQPDKPVAGNGSPLPETPPSSDIPQDHLFDRLARTAQDLAINDLPGDLSENHDHYSHGAPKGLDQI